MIDNLTWCFEWANACFITSRMSRFPSYNRWINSVKRYHLMLLSFQRLQLVNRRLIKGKFLIVENIGVQELFQLTNGSSVILLLLKTIKGVLLKFISFSFIKGLDITPKITIVIRLFVVTWIYFCLNLCLIYWSWLRLNFISLNFTTTQFWHHWRIIKLLISWELFLWPQFF